MFDASTSSTLSGSDSLASKRTTGFSAFYLAYSATISSMTLVIGESSIFTILKQVKLFSYASLSAFVSVFPYPDYDKVKNPPYFISAKSFALKSYASATLTVSKTLSSLIIYAPKRPAR